MPSPKLLKQLEHFNEVRRLMAAAGFTEPGHDVPRLTVDEIREQELGHRVGVSARDVANVLIARRSEHLAAACADGYLVESDESGDPRVVASATAGGR